MKQNLALLIALSFFVTSAIGAPEVGQPAPPFTLTDSHGTKRSLADFKGKIVVLEWLNHGCPFVAPHYQGGNMQMLQKKYTEQDVVWLSVVSSAPGKQGQMSAEATNETTSEKEAAPTAVLLDENGTVGRLYDAKVTPEFFIIDPEGVLVYSGAIDDFKSTSPDKSEAKNYLAQGLDQIMAGKEISVPQTRAYGCGIKY